MPDYSNGKIYTIRCKTDETLIYVGSTIQPLSKRFHQHTKHKDCSLYKYINEFNLDWDEWYIELYENYPCNSKEELNKREGEIIRKIATINKLVAGRTPKEYYIDNADKIKEQRKEYRIDNADKIKEYNKEYRIDNADKIKEQKKEYDKEYRIKNADKKKEYDKEYRIKNIDKVKEYLKEYRIGNADKIKEYRINNADKIKEYSINNADKKREYQTEYRANQRIIKFLNLIK